MGVHLVGLVACFLVFYWSVHHRGGLAWTSSNTALIFNYHPVLMVAGFVFVSSEAVLIYRTGGGSRRSRKARHLALHLLALALGGVGIWAAFRAHNESVPPKDNLYSLHSWLGMAAAVLFGVQWLAGFYTYWYPGARSAGRSAYLPWHVLGGLSVYVLGLIAAETGILEKVTFLQMHKIAGHYDAEPLLANSLGLLVALLGALTILAAVVPDSGKEKSYAPMQ